LAIDEQAYGPNHPAVARDLNNLAQWLADTQREREGQLLLSRALRIEIATHGGSINPSTAAKLGNLAWRFAETERYALAETLMKHAIAINESLGTEQSSLAIDLNNLALVLEVTGRVEEAVEIMRRVRDIDLILASRRHFEDRDAAGRLANYRRMLESLGVAADQIDGQVNEPSRVSPLPPLLPHIHQILGEPPPLDQVLANLTHNEKATADRTADPSPIASLSLDEPITRRLDQLIGPSPLDVPIDQSVTAKLDDLLGPLLPIEQAIEQLQPRDGQQQDNGVWSVPIDDPITPKLNKLLGPLPAVMVD
jgi:tetratricopeptide (TPR) repeat protein